MKKGIKKAAIAIAALLVVTGCGGPQKFSTDNDIGNVEYRELLGEHASFFMDEEFDDYGDMLCNEVLDNGEDGYKRGLANSMRLADGSFDIGYDILSGALNVYCPDVVK